MIVSDVPGTTRDSIDTVLKRGDPTFVLVDTAGLRRKRKQRQGIEYYSELRALDAAERADVALVLVDASEGSSTRTSPSPTSPARRTARRSSCSPSGTSARSRSRTFGRASRSAFASGPAWSPSRRRPAAASRACSTGSSSCSRSTRAASRRPELNNFLQELRAARQAPSKSATRRLNLLYGTQTQTRPPRFRFFVNDPGLVTRDYGYWVENQLRERFELEGVPVSIDFVRRS